MTERTTKYEPKVKPLYLEHFGLQHAPFDLAPNGDFLFAGMGHARALKQLKHIVANERVLTVVTGEVGVGKTTLAKCLLAETPPGVDLVFLSNPSFSRDEILQAIAAELGLQLYADGKRAALAALEESAKTRYGLGRSILILIDEAHLMPPESVEEVRLLTNIESSNEKLFGIVLLGQPELDKVLLAREDLRQVRDRVKFWLDIPPLPRAEVGVYLDHRLRVAGWNGARLFDGQVDHNIWRESGGRPRRINLLADRCMLAAYVENERTVQPRHVKAALSEVKHNPVAVPVEPRRANRWAIGGLVVGTLVLALTVGVGFWIWSTGADGASVLGTQDDHFPQPEPSNAAATVQAQASPGAPAPEPAPAAAPEPLPVQAQAPNNATAPVP